MNGNYKKCSCNLNDAFVDALQNSRPFTSTYDDNIEKLAYRANWTYAKQYPVYNTNYWGQRFSIKQTENVINAYINSLLNDNSLPVFSYSQFKINDSNQIRLVNTVSQASGETAESVTFILRELQYGTKEGDIKNGLLYLNPRQAQKTEDLRKEPKNITGSDETDATKRNLVIAGVTVAVLFGLFFSSKIVANVKDIAD